MAKLYDVKHYSSLQGEDAVKARLSGMLPMIEIANHLFFADVRIGQLRAKDDFLATPIDLNNGGHFDPIKKEFMFIYSKKTKSAVSTPVDVSTLFRDKNVVVIRFPTAYALDPIASARLNGKDERAYLREYPMVMYRKAEVLPLTPSLLFTITGETLSRADRRKLKTKNTHSRRKSPGR